MQSYQSQDSHTTFHPRSQNRQNTKQNMQNMQNMQNSPASTQLKGKNDNPLDNSNLYVKGLWKDCTQVELDDLFKPYGVISQSRVYGDGIGFVRYEASDEAINAITNLHGKKPHVKSVQPLIVRLAYKKIRQPKSVIQMGQQQIEMIVHENTKNVYIRGLPIHCSESELYALCSQYGTITCIRLCKNGFAFVRFLTGDDSRNAIHGLHGKYLPNATYPLLVKLANSDPFEPRIEFRPHDEIPSTQMQTQNTNNTNNYPQQMYNTNMMNGVNQLNQLNQVNMMNLTNSINGLSLSPHNSATIGNVSNNINNPVTISNTAINSSLPALTSQWSNNSVNSLNFGLMLNSNNSFGPLHIVNNGVAPNQSTNTTVTNVYGIQQPNNSSNENHQHTNNVNSAVSVNTLTSPTTETLKTSDTDNIIKDENEHDAEPVDDDENIVYLTDGEEENNDKDNENDENKETNRNDKNTNDNDNKNSPLLNSDNSISKESANGVMSQPISSNATNTSILSNNTSNSVSTLSSNTNIEISTASNTNIPLNTNNTINNIDCNNAFLNNAMNMYMNMYNSSNNMPMYPLNYGNLQQYTQSQTQMPIQPNVPGLVSIKSNSSDNSVMSNMSASSGKFPYFPTTYPTQQQQQPSSASSQLLPNTWLNLNPMNMNINTTPNPINSMNSISLLQNNNSFPLYIPNLMNNNSNNFTKN